MDIFQFFKDRWTPSRITTTLWLDGAHDATITDSGGSVSQWDDKSGNSNNMSQGTGAEQPVTNSETINGKNAILFDGTDDYMNFTSDIGLDDTMVFMVFNSKTFNSGDYLIANAGLGGNKSRFYIHPDKCDFGNAPTTAATIANDTNYMISAVVDGTGDASTEYFYLDGNLEDSGSVDRLTPASNFDIGARVGASEANALIGEAIIILGDITDATRQKVEGYLAWKWSGAL
nr:hypothetical protein 23 [Legionellales bacterium]